VAPPSAVERVSTDTAAHRGRSSADCGVFCRRDAGFAALGLPSPLLAALAWLAGILILVGR
jgi:hypothetical protein